MLTLSVGSGIVPVNTLASDGSMETEAVFVVKKGSANNQRNVREKPVADKKSKVKPIIVVLLVIAVPIVIVASYLLYKVKGENKK